MIAITSDIDWGPDEVINYLVSLFEEYQVKCTFFCTHSSPVLKGVNNKLFELGIHPNFNPLLEGKQGTAEEILDRLMSAFPDSMGIRSHSALQSSYILNLFARKGFSYESNQFLPYQIGVQPSFLWNGLIRLPYIWSDDLHWLYGNTFDDLKIDLEGEGLKILNFHPIHVYLNTVNDLHYQNARHHYQNPDKLKKYRNDGKKFSGVKDGLVSLLDHLKNNKISTYQLSEIKPAKKTNKLKGY